MFRYERPERMEKALALVGDIPDARLLCGGTDLLVGLRKGTVSTPLVIDLKRIPELRGGIEDRDGWLRIAATTVLTDVIADNRIADAFPALVDAALVVGSIQIRNRATLTGNICNASPAADTVPSMLVYGAVVEVAGPGGTRRAPLDEFMVRPGRTALGRGELVSAVELPLPDRPRGTAFGRMTRRRGVDLATVNLCCSVASDGVTRFAFGAVGPRALLATDETGTLADPSADPAARAEILDGILAKAAPISNVRASREYRQAMLSVLSRRALDAALGELEGHRGG